MIDTATNTIIARIPVGKRPWNMAITPDGRKLYVACGRSNAVAVIDTAIEHQDRRHRRRRVAMGRSDSMMLAPSMHRETLLSFPLATPFLLPARAAVCRMTTRVTRRQALRSLGALALLSAPGRALSDHASEPAAPIRGDFCGAGTNASPLFIPGESGLYGRLFPTNGAPHDAGGRHLGGGCADALGIRRQPCRAQLHQSDAGTSPRASAAGRAREFDQRIDNHPLAWAWCGHA